MMITMELNKDEIIYSNGNNKIFSCSAYSLESYMSLQDHLKNDHYDIINQFKIKSKSIEKILDKCDLVKIAERETTMTYLKRNCARMAYGHPDANIITSIPMMRKGVIASYDLKIGHILTEDDLMFARPATEFSSNDMIAGRFSAGDQYHNVAAE